MKQHPLMTAFAIALLAGMAGLLLAISLPAFELIFNALIELED
jgi:hypothetical protein